MSIERRLSATQVILLHLLPAVPFLVCYRIAQEFAPPWLPSFTVLVLAGGCVLVPLELALTVWLCRRAGRPVLSARFTEYHRWPGHGRTVMLVVALLAWAVFVFFVLESWLGLGAFLCETWLPGMDPRIDPGYIFRHSDRFVPGQVWLAAVLALVIGAVVAPAAEEIYFRGQLLPLMREWGAFAPLLHTTLFAVYHLWSPWLIPTRILAVFPFCWVAYRERSIYPSLFAHCLLNFLGDGLPLLALAVG